LAFKVYLVKKNEDKEEGCDVVPDGERPFEAGELEKDSVVYVVLANTSHTFGSRVDYTVVITQPGSNKELMGESAFWMA
jgi:hypothetical protein